MLTQIELEQELYKIGIREGMILEVHSSFKSIGPVDGGVKALIAALQNTLGPSGTLVMPAFCLSPFLPLTEADKALGLSVKLKILGEDDAKTGMGIVPDTFRTLPDVVTGKGIFRIAAWGRNAEAYARESLFRLIAEDGHALLIGVNILRLSAMHCMEDVMPQTIHARFAPPPEALALYPEGEWFVEAWEPEPKPWLSIQAAAYEKGLIRDGNIGSAACMLLPVRPVTALYREALLNDPFGLYGLKE